MKLGFLETLTPLSQRWESTHQNFPFSNLMFKKIHGVYQMNESSPAITLQEFQMMGQFKNQFCVEISPIKKNAIYWWLLSVKTKGSSTNHVILNKAGDKKMFKKVESAISYIKRYCPLIEEINVKVKY
jgi:hypothetical protein